MEDILFKEHISKKYKYDKNLILEYYKKNNLCPKCLGFLLWTKESDNKLKIKTCNMCNGTGFYPNQKE